MHHDELIDLFQLCDLRTRCKLRRVSRFWKHTVTLPEVNTVALVDRRALLVRPISPWRLAHNQQNSPWPPSKNVKYPLTPGWYNVGHPEILHVQLSDHGRGGLLGPHTHTMIYDGSLEEEILYQSVLVSLIRSIGMYCTDLQHIVYFCMRYAIQPLSKSAFDPTNGTALRPCLPQPKFLTILNSKFIIASDIQLSDRYGTLDLEIPVSVWCDRNQTDDDFFREILVCSPAQREWVVQNVTNLPDQYHKWIRNHIQIDIMYSPTDSIYSVSRPGLSGFPDGVDDDQVDPFLLLVLAACIERETAFKKRRIQIQNGG